MQGHKNRVCVILGGGGHARVLIDCLQAWHHERISYAILDPDRSLHGTKLMGIPVVGDDSMIPQLVRQGAKHFVVGLAGIGNTWPRQRLFEMGLEQGLAPLTVIHPSAMFSNAAKIGAGSQLMAASVVIANAQVGRNVIINTSATVDHDCVIDDHVHVATGAVLASAVRVAVGAHIGCGAVIKQLVTVGERAIVGAGAVVVRDVPPHTVVVGVPAKPVR